MKSEDNPSIGTALLALGGGILVGKIIAEFIEDGSTRETRSSTKRKGSSTLSSKVSNKRNQRYIVETQPVQKKSNPSETPVSTNERKYPSSYYSLSKAQQYKYRQKMAKDLIEISQK